MVAVYVEEKREQIWTFLYHESNVSSYTLIASIVHTNTSSFLQVFFLKISEAIG